MITQQEPGASKTGTSENFRQTKYQKLGLISLNVAGSALIDDAIIGQN
jgi:hypothetical protein